MNRVMMDNLENVDQKESQERPEMMDIPERM